MTYDEQIPAGPVRSTAVGLIGTLAHARKYVWAEQPEVAELLRQLDSLVDELVCQLPENHVKEEANEDEV